MGSSNLTICYFVASGNSNRPSQVRAQGSFSEILGKAQLSCLTLAGLHLLHHRFEALFHRAATGIDGRVGLAIQRLTYVEDAP